jgi:hypothetical protein
MSLTFREIVSSLRALRQRIAMKGPASIVGRVCGTAVSARRAADAT